MYHHLRPELQNSDPAPWRCLRFSGTVNFLSLIALAIAIGFLAALLHTLAIASYASTTSGSGNTTLNVTLNCSDALVADNTTCALSTDCLQGFWAEADATCAYHPRPTSVTNCSSPCFSMPGGATQCNGAGLCVGDSAACYGTCAMNADCDLVDKFQLNEDLVYTAAEPSLWPYTSWYEPYGCWYEQCVALILEILVGSSANPIHVLDDGTTYNFTALAANNECEDYLLPAFVSAYRPCLSFSREALASSMVNYSEIGNNVFGNATLPFQLSICIIRFTCGVSSEDAVEEKKKRHGHTDVYKSAEEWGFLPATHADRYPLGDRASPRMNSAFWGKTREIVERALPPFLDRVVKGAAVIE
jgi:hypothetical protein